MKKFYLYLQPLLTNSFGENTGRHRGDWYFDDEFDSYEKALDQAKINSERGSWKIWKIEEVYDFAIVEIKEL